MMHEIFDNKMKETIRDVKSQYESQLNKMEMHLVTMPDGVEKDRLKAIIKKVKTGNVDFKELMNDLKNVNGPNN